MHKKGIIVAMSSTGLTTFSFAEPLDSQGGCAPFMGRVLTEAIETKLLDSYLDKTRSDLSQRYHAVCNVLRDEPRITNVTEEFACRRAGGYFLWLEFPRNVDARECASYCLKEHGIRFMAGPRCDPFGSSDMPGLSINQCARICFADVDRDVLVDASIAFVSAFRSYIDETNKNS